MRAREIDAVVEVALTDRKARGDVRLASLIVQRQRAMSKLRVEELNRLIRARERVLDGLGIEEPASSGGSFEPPEAELEDGDDTEPEPDLADALGI